MTDNFEKAKDKILKEAKANGGITVDHLFDALSATNEDLDEQHQQTLRWHQEVVGMVETHLKEAELRDQRIKTLEECVEEAQSTCADRVRRLIHEEHEVRHTLHLTTEHSPEASFQSKLVWFFATTIGKLLLVVFGIIAGIVLTGTLTK